MTTTNLRMAQLLHAHEIPLTPKIGRPRNAGHLSLNGIIGSTGMPGLGES
jgi:hypothetical protein